MKPTLAAKHPDARKQGPRLDAERYRAMKAAILKVVPRHGGGIMAASLPGLVAKHLPQDTFAGASIPWYAVTVKLDLEARGLIRRVPGARPQRITRGRQVG